jgi:hypothetical protein
VLVGRKADELLALQFAVDVERARVEAFGPFAIELADVAGVVVIDHHLHALPFVVTAQEQPRANAPIGLDVDQQLEVAKFAVGEQDAAVAAAGRVLLAGDRAVFDLPDAAGSVADLLRILVPTGQRFAVEQFDPTIGRCGVSEAMERGHCGEGGRGSGGFQEAAASSHGSCWTE